MVLILQMVGKYLEYFFHPESLIVYILNYVNEYITIRKLEKLDDWLSGSFENPELHEIKKLPQNITQILSTY